jgi:hypothetical protein
MKRFVLEGKATFFIESYQISNIKSYVGWQGLLPKLSLERDFWVSLFLPGVFLYALYTIIKGTIARDY